MWLQWIDLPGFRAVRKRRLTHLAFPQPLWGPMEESVRAEALAEWYRRSRELGFPAELEELLVHATRHAAGTHYLHERMLERELANVPALLGRVRRATLLRALFARRPEAR